VVSREDLPGSNEEALPALIELELHARQELAGDAPAFCPRTATWAARILYEACRATVCRDLAAAAVKAALALPCPAARTPESDWSADLVFRHLPELLRFACQLSRADPLGEDLRALAAAWPLSSVGVPGLPPVVLDSFFGHPSLRRLYADRILATGDLSRLADARVADLVRADLGWHRELAPALARTLFPEPEPEPRASRPPDAASAGTGIHS
jgi:hypothetical protein